MGYLFSMLVGLFIGFAIRVILYDSNIAIKLSNMMNASMLDCVTHKIITKEQVHDIESVFHKHIEINFKHIKAYHCDNCKKDK